MTKGIAVFSGSTPVHKILETGVVDFSGSVGITGSLTASNITLNTIGNVVEPEIRFFGSGSTDSIDLRVISGSTLSFEGTEGQLFSITNNLTSGTIFAVGDVSGMPLIEADASGTVSMARFGTKVGIGTNNPTSVLTVSGTFTVTGSSLLNSVSGTNATFVSITGSGGGITNLTSSNINNFTNDVRAQFSAGTNIDITNGVISVTGAVGGGGSTPGGPEYSVQFNSGSSLSGSSNLLYNYNTDILTGQTAQFTNLTSSNVALIATGSITEPSIEFRGSGSSNSIDLKVKSDSSLSFEGTAGTLLYVSDNLTSGTIFSVNDAASLPLLEVDANGTVSIAEFAGNVGIGTSSPQYKLDVNGTLRATGNSYFQAVSGTTATFSNYVSGNIGQFSGVTSSYLALNGVSTEPTQRAGTIFYDGTNGLMRQWTEVTDVDIHLGQQLAVRVKNDSGATLAKGKIVHLTGSTNSDTPLVTTASYESDSLSADTLGVLMSQLGPNDIGYALLNGVLTGIDLSTYASGDMLYLSSSGDFSNSVPLSPLHEVRIAQVTRATNNGAMFVRIQNGYETDELHDVLFSSKAEGDIISWDATTGVWRNKKELSGSYTVTGTLNVNDDLTVGTDSLFVDTSADRLGVALGGALPSASLHVRNNNAKILLDTVSNPTSYNLELVSNYNAADRWYIGQNTGSIRYVGYKNTGTFSIYSHLYLSSYYGMSFHVGNSPTGSNAKMVIDNYGKVGIGTNTPEHTLSVTGTLGVSGIATFSTITASNVQITNLDVDTITAREYYTELVTASVIYESGSTKFGDTSDDIHDFTGSVNIVSGNLMLGAPDENIDRTLTIHGSHSSNKLFYITQTIGGPVFGYSVANQNISFGTSAQPWGAIQHYAASAHRFFIGSSQKVTIDSNGFVGIGTTTPSSSLEVQSSTNQLTLTSISTSGVTQPELIFRQKVDDGTYAKVGRLYAQPYDRSSGSYYSITTLAANTRGTETLVDRIKVQNRNSQYDVAFLTGSGGEAMRVHYNGNIGIGATDPQDALSIQVPTGTTKGIFFQDGSTTNFGTKLKYNETDNKFFIEQLENGSQTGIFTIQRADGNVGIGTTSPAQKLDVNGAIAVGGVSVINTNSTPTDMYINSRVIRNESTVNQDGMFINYSSTGGSNAHLRFYANGATERARIHANTGYFGIGTSNPSYPLDVYSGRVRIDGIRYDETQTNDGYIYFAAQKYIEHGNFNKANIFKNSAGGDWNVTEIDNTTTSSNSVPFSKVVYHDVYSILITDFIPVQAGETIYGEMWAMRESGATGSAGSLYIGVERFDKDKNPIAANFGTSYFITANSTVPTNSTWTKHSGTTTLPLTHTPYNSSDGGPVRYIRLKVLLNYNTGTIRTYWGGLTLRRQKIIRDQGDVTFNGNVGIGTTSPGELLDVRTSTATAGQGARLGEAKVGTWESNNAYAAFTHNSVHGTANSYALLQYQNGETFLNSAAGRALWFRQNNSTNMLITSTGDVVIGNKSTASSKLDVVGDATISGTLNMSGSIIPGGDGVHEIGAASNRFGDVYAVQTTVGAVFETGLTTPGIEEYPTGTVLVWRQGKLTPCDKNEDVMVMGVGKKGKQQPIILGAEPVLVTGKVEEGDWIVTSDKPGHGKALKKRWWKRNLTGKIIAQALESCDGDSNLIKCMINKT